MKAVLPRGKKLCMADGNFQIVRSYERNGDTVRYYSLERSDWEEMPASLVDWDATAKAEAEQTKKEKEFAATVRTRERNQNSSNELDIDASLLSCLTNPHAISMNPARGRRVN